jgi:hypothetical protein
MTLLEDIQNSAVDAKSDLGTLLRKCKLLAARLGSQPLEDWLVWESNGYPDDIAVPEYRVWPLEVKGHFAGPLGSGLRNAPIPLVCIPKEAREHYERYECRHSIATIEATLAQAKSGTVKISTGDLALILESEVYQYQNCLQAWAVFGTGHLVELINSVRNRVLDFALAVWKEAPEAGEPGSGATIALEATKVTQIFNTTIYGGSANLVGTANSSTIAFNIGTGDFSSLETFLLESGLSEKDTMDLRAALESETAPTMNEGFGPKVSSWVATMMGKAADGSWKIGLAAAGNLLGRAIASYYGLP